MGLKIAYILSTRDHPSSMGLDMLSLKFIEKYKRPINPLKESGWRDSPAGMEAGHAHGKEFNVLGVDAGLRNSPCNRNTPTEIGSISEDT